MLIAYLAHVNDGGSSGVVSKMAAQATSWRAVGHEVRFFVLTRDADSGWTASLGDFSTRRYRSWQSRLRAIDGLVGEIRAYGATLIYMRYDLFYPPMLRLPRRARLVIEINTDDRREYALGSRPRRLYNEATRGLILRRASAIVCVTSELADAPQFRRFRGRRETISNGIDLAGYPEIPAPANDPPRLVFVGSLNQPWQGTDKVMRLAALRPSWAFDIVGPADGLQGTDLPSNVMLHGRLERVALLRVLATADIAIGTLALHRKAMREACPLKVREYLAVGLPVVYGYADADADRIEAGVLRIGNTEDNIVDELPWIDRFVARATGTRIPRSNVAHIDTSRKEAQRLTLFDEIVRDGEGGSTAASGRRPSAARRGRRTPRLLLVTTSPALGGAERQVVELAIAFRRRGWTVTVVSMTPPSAFVDELEEVHIDTGDLGMARGRPSPGALLRYLRVVRARRPDIIHSHMVHANLLARAGRITHPSIPLVCTVHNTTEGARWREIAYRATDRLASVTTAITAAASDRYVSVGAVPRDRIVTIPNGLDMSRFSATEEARQAVRDELGTDGFLWSSIGRLHPQKGYDLLLHAFAEVRSRWPEARLAIAGEGPERARLEGIVVDLDLASSVQLLGPRRDVAAILAASDGFVLSSRWEGLPMVLLEAAAHGLPISTTDVGGCRDIARPELGAVLTTVDIVDIARGMSSLMELPESTRSRVGEDLREHVRAEFDLDVIVGRWESLYDRFITP